MSKRTLFAVASSVLLFACSAFAPSQAPDGGPQCQDSVHLRYDSGDVACPKGTIMHMRAPVLDDHPVLFVYCDCPSALTDSKKGGAQPAEQTQRVPQPPVQGQTSM